MMGKGSIAEVFAAFLRLGLTSFGGPIAHLGYFRAEFVDKRRWLDEVTFADVIALSQVLPGPASSEAGIALGLMRAGYAGAFAAWIGFTAPSAILMILFGYGLSHVPGLAAGAGLHGLKLVAVAVVARAVLVMARTLTPDAMRAALAIAAAVFAPLVPTALGQAAILLVAAAFGWWLLPASTRSSGSIPLRIAPVVAAVSAGLFFVLLIGLPIAARISGSHMLAVVDGFYRSGALVFGGGHVVLPLLQAAVVPPGWVSPDDFLAGYGAAQAVPGPLFTFAAFLGTVMHEPPSGWLGGVLCLIAIFAPAFLLVFGALPIWTRMRAHPGAQAALAGVNAAVVGLLAAALYDPVLKSAVFGVYDALFAALAFALLGLGLPQWAVVIAGFAAAMLLSL